MTEKTSTKGENEEKQENEKSENDVAEKNKENKEEEKNEEKKETDAAEKWIMKRRSKSLDYVKLSKFTFWISLSFDTPAECGAMLHSYE